MGPLPSPPSPQVAKATPAETLGQRRVEITTRLNGTIVSVGPEGSKLFGWDVSAAVGTSLCEVIDVFGDWRSRCGSDSEVPLLLLALLGKEAETPGGCRGCAVAVRGIAVSWGAPVADAAGQGGMAAGLPWCAALCDCAAGSAAGALLLGRCDAMVQRSTSLYFGSNRANTTCLRNVKLPL